MLVLTTMQASHVSRIDPFSDGGLLHRNTVTNRHQYRHTLRIHAVRLLHTNHVLHSGLPKLPWILVRTWTRASHLVGGADVSFQALSKQRHTHTHSRLGPSRMPTPHCGWQAGLLNRYLAQRFSCFAGRHTWLDRSRRPVRLDGACETARFHTANVCEADALGKRRGLAMDGRCHVRTEICSLTASWRSLHTWAHTLCPILWQFSVA